VTRFLTRCVLELADDQDDGQFILAAPLVYRSDVAARVIVVPAGFQTDLASVPRLPLVFLLAGDCAREAAIVHDYLYSTHLIDRKTADAVLREASACTGVSALRRWLMWAGVRIGGASHWGPDVEPPQQMELRVLHPGGSDLVLCTVNGKPVIVPPEAPSAG
jgi:hypothetical protein